MTKICDYCGKEFDEQDAREEFEATIPKNYDHLTKCLCADCAIEAIDDMDYGIYYEICENCGCRFDPVADEYELRRQTGNDGVEIDMFGDLCLDCALDEYRNRSEEDDDESERLSVYDAAMIWASHGKDEDYTYGYSESELESVL